MVLRFIEGSYENTDYRPPNYVEKNNLKAKNKKSTCSSCKS